MNTKKDLVKAIAEDCGLPQPIVEEVLESLNRAGNEFIINDGELKIMNLVTIATRVLPPRRAMDISTRQYVDLPECKTLKARVNRKLLKSFKTGKMMDSDRQVSNAQSVSDQYADYHVDDYDERWPDDDDSFLD